MLQPSWFYPGTSLWAIPPYTQVAHGWKRSLVLSVYRLKQKCSFFGFQMRQKSIFFQLICLSSFTCLKRLSVYPSLPKSGLCLFVFCQPLIGIFSFAKVFDLPLRKDRKPERVWEWESKTQLLYYDVFENFCHYFVGIVFQFFTFEPQASKFFSGKLILAGDCKSLLNWQTMCSFPPTLL